MRRTAEGKGFRVKKVSKGPHHGRFAIVKIADGARMPPNIRGAEFYFSLEQGEACLANL